MNLTVEDGRELLKKCGLKAAVIVAYDPDTDEVRFVTVGSDAEKADMAVRLRECIASALCLEGDGELLEDRRWEHPKPGEED
jgi:hypothetical protein